MCPVAVVRTHTQRNTDRQTDTKVTTVGTLNLPLRITKWDMAFRMLSDEITILNSHSEKEYMEQQEAGCPAEKMLKFNA